MKLLIKNIFLINKIIEKILLYKVITHDITQKLPRSGEDTPTIEEKKTKNKLCICSLRNT